MIETQKSKTKYICEVLPCFFAGDQLPHEFVVPLGQFGEPTPARLTVWYGVVFHPSSTCVLIEIVTRFDTLIHGLENT